MGLLRATAPDRRRQGPAYPQHPTRNDLGGRKTGARKLRPAFLLLLLTLAALGWTNDVLILIRSDRINHAIRPEFYDHKTWVLWPKPWDGSAANLYMSPLSGHDWKATASDLAFKEDEGGTMVALNAASLEERGYNEARRQVVGPQSPLLVLRDDGSRSAEAMLIAMGYDGKVHTVEKGTEFQRSRLLVYDALNWDDAAGVAELAGGKALVLGYPPQPGSRLSPFWLFKGWGEGLLPENHEAMPGLIHSRDVGKLLLNSEDFTWTRAEQPRWKGAGYWFRTLSPLQSWFRIALGVLAAFASALAAFFVAHEKRSHISRLLLLTVFFAVPAAGLAGHFGLRFGPSLLLPATIGLWVALTLMASIVAWAAGAKRLQVLAMLSLLLCTFSNFEFSLLNTLYDQGELQLACLVASVAGVIGFSAGMSVKLRTILIFSALSLLIAGFNLNPWWAGSLSVGAVLLLGSLVAAGLTRIAAGGAILFGVAQASLHGFSFAPVSLGRIDELGDARAINLGFYASLATSPLFLGALLMTGAAFALGGRFFWYELHKLSKADGRRLSVFRAGVITMAIGLAVPQWLLPGAMITVAGLMLFLYDCVGEV